MATISRTGIGNGSTIQAEHLTRIIDALDGGAATTIVATGSFTGSFVGDGSGLTGVGGDSFPYTGSAIISGSLSVYGSFGFIDTAGQYSIRQTSPSTRLLMDSSGQTSVDWENKWLFDSTNTKVIQWEAQQLTNQAGITLDWSGKYVAIDPALALAPQDPALTPLSYPTGSLMVSGSSAAQKAATGYNYSLYMLTDGAWRELAFYI